jgi:hypothetical protein
MRRITSRAVRSGIAATQAIVRSERAHSKRSAMNCRNSPRKTAKTRGSYFLNLIFCAFSSATLPAAGDFLDGLSTQR